MDNQHSLNSKHVMLCSVAIYQAHVIFRALKHAKTQAEGEYQWSGGDGKEALNSELRDLSSTLETICQSDWIVELNQSADEALEEAMSVFFD